MNVVRWNGAQSRRYVHSTGSERKIVTARDEVDVRGGVTDPFWVSRESAWGFARDALPFAIDPNEEKSCARSTHPPTTFLAAAGWSSTVLPAILQHRNLRLATKWAHATLWPTTTSTRRRPSPRRLLVEIELGDEVHLDAADPCACGSEPA